ncbi:lipocalin-like domain-containing protein [Ascidiaceihabitans sp.]|uniref:lipocalin-like domain-containing protein n=1 Tax=Ascidiaceihabitans sp. TaxID=1872644 RepID=UPI00329964C1
MNVRALVFLLCLPAMAWAQGFGGLGTQADGFTTPRPNPVFDFPQDHGPHPDYRIEWWYLTANMTGPDGAEYGLQWTLFRSALAPEVGVGWTSPQIYFGHAAVSTKDAHYVAERFARGGIGQAGVTPAPFEAWIDDWHLKGDNFDTMQMHATGPEFAYDVTLDAQGPLVFHGDGGFSVKSAKGQASYYYSQPFYDLSGTLTLPDGPVPVTGTAWLDREWSSQPLADDQSGWDWFSLSFEDGNKLMGFRLRQTDGTFFASGTWIAPDGTPTALRPDDFIASPMALSDVGGRDVPTTWRVQVPRFNVDVTTTALNPQAWMAVSLPYWEGPVTVQGSHTGRGYLEMTGYE